MKQVNPTLYTLPFLAAITMVSGMLTELVAMSFKTFGWGEWLPRIAMISLPAFLGGALLPYLLIRVGYRSTLKEFGVRWLTPGRANWRWLLGASIFVMVIWVGFWGLIYWGLHVAAQNPQASIPTFAELNARNPLEVLLRDGYQPGWFAYMFHMTFLVGLTEELFGRGFLQNALDRRFLGVWGKGRFTVRTSTLLAAALFAFWHTEWLSLDAGEIVKSLTGAMTIVLVPSLILAVVYERTRSMLIVILLHNVIDSGKFVAWYFWGQLFPG